MIKIDNMKYSIRFFIAILGVAFFSNISNAQMSFYSKLDTVQGYISKAIPSGQSMFVFNSFRYDTDTAKFRLTKLDECRDLDWVKDYYDFEEDVLTTPDAISKKDEIYLLLMSKLPNAGALKLAKLDSDGEIIWSKKITSDNSSLLSSFNSNLLTNIDTTKLYIVTNDDGNNTVIMSLDLDGTILESKKLEGIQHRASAIDREGDLLVFADKGVYTKVHLNSEIIDSIVWVRKLKDREFDVFYDPITILNEEDTSLITVVVDNSLKEDTTVFRLAKFDADGKLLKETKGFYAPEEIVYGDSKNSLKTKKLSKVESAPFNTDPRPIYFMLRNKVFFFNTNLERQINPKIYKFNVDTFNVIDGSLEICEDESLVMTGFCYDRDNDDKLNFENPYMFISKTQPNSFKVEAEEPKCLKDSTARFFLNMTPTKIDTFALVLDTVELASRNIEIKYDFVTDLNENKCGKIKMESKEDSITICPGKYPTFEAPGLNCAAVSYVWEPAGGNGNIYSTGIEGDYTCTANFCDTIRVSKFKLRYKELDECFEALFPNAMFVSEITDSSDFRIYQKLDDGDKFEFTQYELKVFDRWGEKVFETVDPNVGWDGTYKGKTLPPGVYLYSASWTGILNKKKEYSSSKKGQIVLLQ